MKTKIMRGTTGLLILMIVFLTACGNNSGYSNSNNNLNGTWSYYNILGSSRITFSGNTFSCYGPDGTNLVKVGDSYVSGTGTFSIWGDQIEFKSLLTKAFNFARTENTITINGQQFTRS